MKWVTWDSGNPITATAVCESDTQQQCQQDFLPLARTWALILQLIFIYNLAKLHYQKYAELAARSSLQCAQYHIDHHYHWIILIVMKA